MSVFPHRPGVSQWGSATVLSLAAHGLLLLPFLQMEPWQLTDPPERRPPPEVITIRPGSDLAPVDPAPLPPDEPLEDESIDAVDSINEIARVEDDDNLDPSAADNLDPSVPDEVAEPPEGESIPAVDSADQVARVEDPGHLDPSVPEEAAQPVAPPRPDEPEAPDGEDAPLAPPFIAEPMITDTILPPAGGDTLAAPRDGGATLAPATPFGTDNVIGQAAPFGQDLPANQPATIAGTSESGTLTIGADIPGRTIAPAASQDTRISAASDVGQPIAAMGASAVAPSVGGARPPPSGGARGIDDPELLDLLERIRSRLIDPCLVALARGGGAAPLEVLIISNDDQAIADFETAVLSDLGFPLQRTRQLIDNLQCPALDLVRAHPRYPAFPVAIGLTQDQIASGENLTGVVRGVGGAALSMMIVDDNGVTQNLQRFVTQFEAEYRFEIPMTRDGAARDTRQLLVALVTRLPARAITAQDGFLAEDVFGALRRELSEPYSLGIVTFDVQ